MLDELRRRNVIRMAGLYLVGAWLIVQVTGTLLPMFEAPAWVARVIVLVLAVGFVPALVLSWVFELTPEGLKRESDVDRGASITNVTGRRMDRLITVGLGLALAYFAIDRLAFAPKREAALVAEAKSSAVAEERKTASANAKSIAVLPFVDLSPNKDQEYFSDGIAEELLNRLAQSPDLKVAARTSAFQFKGKSLDMVEIGRQLNVVNLLEGSVRKAGERLRITAQLINSETGFHLWSQTYERDASDVFKVQDEIAGAIAQALEAKLLGRSNAAVPARSAAPAAFDEYLKGRSLFAKRLGDNIPLAIQAYDRALALDPDFGPAHSARAFAYAIAPGFSSAIPVDEASSKALAGAERALELDPDNAEAYLVRGTVRSYQFRETAARVDLDRALALAPGNVDVLNFVGDDLQYSGNLRAAERLKRQAMALDPLAFVHPTNLSTILLAQGRHAEALDYARRAVALGGGWFTQRDLLNAQLRVHDIEGARASAQAICAELGPDDDGCMAVEVQLHGADGDKAAYARSLERYLAAIGTPRNSVFASDIGVPFAAYSNDIPTATKAMRKAFRGFDFGITMTLLLGPNGARLPEEVSTDPDWLAYWSRPEMQELMDAYRTNLSAFRAGN